MFLLHRLVGTTLAWLALALASAQAADLPEPIRQGFAQHHIAASGLAFVVQPLDGGALDVSVGANRPMNPASTMKLLTTFAALSILGPDFHWQTRTYLRGRLTDGRLDGDLLLRGGGDPALVVERLWLLVQRIRALGVREIRGDVLVDRTRFAPDTDATASVDHDDLRPYNVAPDALLINFRALSLDFVPQADGGTARIVATPALAGIRLPESVPLNHAACADWKTALKADFSRPLAPRFGGSLADGCGPRTWHVSAIERDDYVQAVFRQLWTDSGGTWQGRVRPDTVRATDVLLTEALSPPLADVIRDINKNSNNVMARQVFLTLAAADAPVPGDAVNLDTGQSAMVVKRWLAQSGLPMPELVLRNGSGLSREERISAASLAALLGFAWRSDDMPSFLASLPLAGVDGTMQHRHTAVHSAYVKTGYLAGVRALAGFVFSASGHHYVIVALVNDAHADDAQVPLDRFLQWVWERG